MLGEIFLNVIFRKIESVLVINAFLFHLDVINHHRNLIIVINSEVFIQIGIFAGISISFNDLVSVKSAYKYGD